MRYKMKIVITVVMTTKSLTVGFLSVSSTLSKSIGFGSTKKSPPNAERWLHKHWIVPLVVDGPGCSDKYIID